MWQSTHATRACGERWYDHVLRFHNLVAEQARKMARIQIFESGHDDDQRKHHIGTAEQDKGDDAIANVLFARELLQDFSERFIPQARDPAMHACLNAR